MSHDERFKVLLREFLREFFELFFPDLIGQLDFANAVWLQQELIADPPTLEKRTIDLLVQIPLLPAAGAAAPPPQVVYIHIEVESADTVEPLRRRMYHYFDHLTHVLNLEVLPIAVYLRVGLEGRGIDAYEVRVLGRTPLRFEYDYVGLPALEGADYLTGGNVLGHALSALMAWPRADRPRAAVEALERIVTSTETPRRKLLLCDCVNVYAPLDADQRIELRNLLQEPQRTEVKMFGKTWHEEGLEEGIEKGLEKGIPQGQRALLLTLLETRFGSPISETARQRLDSWPADKLAELGRAMLAAQSLKEMGLED